MGFWSIFFGAGAANVYNEIKKEEKETQKWNDNLHMIMNYEEEFSNYLKSIGSNAVYIPEVDESAASVRRQIDRYKRKIKEFLNLGGEGKYIYDVEELDEYIEVMKYLKSVDCIDRQEEFLGLDLCFAKDTIEREKEEQTLQKESEIAEIIGTDINSLSGIEFEKVCQKLVENMGFETEITKASGDGGIDLIAYNHQPLLSGKYIIQCKRYSGSVGEPIIRDLYGVITSERANKGILMTTGYFTKSAIAFAEGKPIELIGGEKLRELLKCNGICVSLNESIKKNVELNWKIDNGNSDEANFYNYHMQLLQGHPNELLYQLTFLEVAVTRLYTEVWCEGNFELQDIISDFYNVLNRLNIDSLGDNLKYSIMFLNTPVLLLEKKFDELITKYYELLNWNELINSVSELTGLDETYFTVVNNLIQILLLLGRTEEANDIRSKHNQVIENQLDYFEGQIGFDDDVTERFSKLKEVTLSKGVGYFFFLEYSGTSIKIGENDKMVFNNHYSHIYSDCIEHPGIFLYENEVFWNEIYIVKKDDGRYYLETYDKNILFF